VAKSTIAAKYYGLEIATPEFTMGETNQSADFLAKFPTSQVPAFENDKVALFESSAIAYYVASQGNGSLLGANKEQSAEIVQWMLFASNQLEGPLTSWVLPILGYAPYNAVTYNKAVQETKKAMSTLDAVLLKKTYLVGEKITLADILVACALFAGFRMVLSPEHRDEYKNLMRYVNTLFAQPEFVAALGEVEFCATETKYQAPKKEAAKKEAAKKEVKPAEVDVVATEAPKKVKSKLDLLPPTSFNLEDWKRFYSNNDTKPDAMNYFWEHFDPEGFSIWRATYKYNDELTQIFMSSNLIGGFFERLDLARKYAFGAMCVLGEDNNNKIDGYFVIRGQEVPEEVSHAADFDSYTFTKVEDLKDEKFRASIADFFAWEDESGNEAPAGKTFK